MSILDKVKTLEKMEDKSKAAWEKAKIHLATAKAGELTARSEYDKIYWQLKKVTDQLEKSLMSLEEKPNNSSRDGK